MPRPADWCLLDLANDPTPGEPSAVIALSLRVSRIAEDATRAERGVRGLAANSAVTTWIGAAGDVFRGALDDFPVQLRKLADSYDQCARALSTLQARSKLPRTKRIARWRRGGSLSPRSTR